MDTMITVENLHKRYGKKTAVRNLNFHVPDGQVTGFLGPNGSGKSTSMRCMLGLDAPTSGHVNFSGTYSTGEAYSGAFSALDRKAAVAGSVLDSYWFDPKRSGRNHLRAIASGAGISDKRVDECLELVGLTQAAKSKVGGYSLGMKQRLGLATALLGNPQHLLLDEPVNGLDPEGVSWIRRVIRQLASDGRAVLVSSHLLSEMQQTADRLVVIGRGELIGEFTMDEFLSEGTTIVVESREAVLLAEQLRREGLTVDVDMDRVLSVQIPQGQSDAEIRTHIAQTALSQGYLITQLNTVAANLEQRFLAATANAQEYRTQTPTEDQ
ncbi:ATP-binding cassette domain-containing protein [Corynebacterium sp. 4HC-13]|uniref:ATP-binding cassette domain-containing protein n=2 Tax=Corynebacterium anserum TaxID=2684406 RepID=A0A7G7YR91_9CORY|nr:ATP-binding cassette domain-containing protein [Corynebacterium anserum]QNH97011.1 ATP-binding cassette domain-containing protein [Corynebacterium anserum]